MEQQIQTPSATYTFRLYPIQTKFKRIAGIYIFLIIPYPELSPTQIPPSKGDKGGCQPVAEALEATQHPASIIHPYSLLYVGITNDFYARLQTHHKIQAAITLGMTHIGILRKSSGRARKNIEKNILKHLNPPLNQTWIHDIQKNSPFEVG